MNGCVCNPSHSHINIGGHVICAETNCNCMAFTPAPIGVSVPTTTIETKPEINIDSFKADIDLVKKAMFGLNSVIFEREEEIKMIFLCLLAKQHGIFYGLGGSGKSDMVRKVSEVTGRAYWEYQVSQFTTLDEIYGPWNLVDMRESGQMRRVIDGLMLEAEMVFLDEVGNSSSPIRNALKPLLNERQYNFGREIRYAPLETLISASNSVLEYEDATEAAFEDRFLARRTVQYLREDSSVEAMLMGRGKPNSVQPIPREVIQRLQKVVKSVQMTQQFAQQAIAIRKQIASDSNAGALIVSDRRFNQTMDLAAANAVLNGRKTYKKSDLAVFALTFWKNPDDENKLHEYLRQMVDTVSVKLESIEQSCAQIVEAFKQSLTNPAITQSPAAGLQRSVLAKANLEGQKAAINQLKRSAEEQDEIDSANDILSRIMNWQRDIELASLDLQDQENSQDYDDLSSLKKVR